MHSDAAAAPPGGRLSHGDQLARAARRRPEAVAIRDDVRALRYAELDGRVDRLAAALRSRGIGRGDRVALLLRNRTEFVESFYAACRLGAIAVPVNFRSVPAEIAYVLSDSEAALLITEETLRPAAAAAVDRLPAAPALVVVTDGATVAGGAEDYEDLLGEPAPGPVEVDVPETDPMAILYTSGTTGRPKGAVITHLAMATQSMMRISAQRLQTDEEVWLSGMQLFHAGALSSLLPCVMIAGEFVTMGPEPSGTAAIADRMEALGVTSASLVPTQWQEFCALPGIDGRSFAVRRISWGTAPASPELLARMHALFPGVQISNLFGQTETCGAACTLTGPLAEQYPGSVGRALPNVEVRIVDDALRDVEVGAVGEVVYRGPTVMREYWRRPDATREAWAGGWFHSGDLARRDENGLLWVVDRKKDMIISGGENIYSAEVEHAVASHPGVAEVAVIGVAHPRWGETPCAVVVPADPDRPPTLEEIVDHCRERLASYKKPTELRIVPALPRNNTGKVLKYALRGV